MNETAIHRRVAACRAGTDLTCVARLGSGWAVLGDPQVLRGYCLLLPDPVVPHLQALALPAQQAFLADMARLGQAVYEELRPVRVNYALFGNVEPALHAHVLPRHADEPPHLFQAHPWVYDWNAAPRFDQSRDGALIKALRDRLMAAR
jgi:diadenosine tetraphosphate (Ap4A) HIT family hydrolase